jgi:hypothetical protein
LTITKKIVLKPLTLTTNLKNIMKRTVLIGILSLYVQLGYSQKQNETNKTEKIMEKTSILGLRTTIY